MIRGTLLRLSGALTRRRLIVPFFFFIVAFLSSAWLTLPHQTGRAANSTLALQPSLNATGFRVPSVQFGEIIAGRVIRTDESISVLRSPDIVAPATLTTEAPELEREQEPVRQGENIAPSPPRHFTFMGPASGCLVKVPRPTFYWRLSDVPGDVQKVTYTFKVVELQPEQNLEDALLKNPPVLEKANLSEVFFQVPGKGSPFRRGRIYAWRVTAADARGSELSKSPAAFFAWGSWPPSICALFGSGDLEYCIDRSRSQLLQVGIALMSGSGDYSWTWTPDITPSIQGGSGSSGSSTITISGNMLPTTPGTYTYTLTVTRSGCTRTMPVTIHVSQGPDAGKAWVSGATRFTDPPNWQPSINVCCGTAWKLKLDPPSRGPIIGNVQWQQNTGAGWSNVPGATGANANVNPDLTLCSAPQPIQYRAVVSTTNPLCANYISNVVTVFLSPPAQPGTLTASPAVICNDGSSASQISLTGQVGAVTWSRQSPCGTGSWTPLTPAGPSFSTGPLTQTTCYKATVQSGPPGPYACPPVDSIVTVEVDQQPVAGTIKAIPAVICPGDDSELTLTGSSGLVQWYSSTNPNPSTFFVPGNMISGATNNTTQNTNILNQTTYYGVQVSSPGGACPAVQSAIVEVTLKPLPTPLKIDVQGNGYICPGGTASLLMTSAPQPGTYAWFCDGALCGPNSPSMTVTQPGNYWLELNNGCATVVSDIITIKPDLLTVAIPGPSCSRNGQKVQLCAEATNGVEPYKYSWSNGATTSCITFFATVTTTYTVTVTDATGCIVPKSFTVTVCQ